MQEVEEVDKVPRLPVVEYRLRQLAHLATIVRVARHYLYKLENPSVVFGTKGKIQLVVDRHFLTTLEGIVLEIYTDLKELGFKEQANQTIQEVRNITIQT